MSQFFKYFFSLFFVFLILIVSLDSNNFSKSVSAATFNKAYLFFERMQTDSQTGMVLMFTPSSNFVSSGELKITFLSDIGEWCIDSAPIVVTGVGSSAVDIEGWQIDEALPTETSLEATCVPGDPIGDVYDSIVVQNIGDLTMDTAYGIRFDENANFKTSSTQGTKEILIELDDGLDYASKIIAINLVESDSVSFSAFVSDIGTITCNISTSNISFDILPRSGSYTTRQHSLSTESSLVNGYYWAVYGQGDGTNAGLWKSTVPTSLIPSTGTTTINLSQNQGFGLRANSSSGVIPDHFSDSNSNVFGAINSGSSNSRLIFHESANTNSNIIITLGARVGASTEVGPHSETLTYFCGGLY
jgi:hypothetical protein